MATREIQPRYTEGKVRKRNTKKVDAELLAKMKTLYKNGYSYGRIGEMFRISRVTVLNYITGKSKVDL